MSPKHFRLTSVEPTPTAGLRLHYADGEQFELSLIEIIERHPTLWRLKTPAVFSSAKVGAHGASVIWADDDDLELAGDNLRARAVEQAGGVSHEFIWKWMALHALTIDTAAAGIGVSRRLLASCLSGATPVPRTVALACVGWEAVMKDRSRLTLAV